MFANSISDLYLCTRIVPRCDVMYVILIYETRRFIAIIFFVLFLLLTLPIRFVSARSKLYYSRYFFL